MSSEESRPVTDMGWGGSALWYYHKLSGDALSSELARLSNPQTIHKTDCVTLQPSLTPDCTSQDRFVVLQLDLPGGQWQLNGIFDGHAGHETVDYIVTALPPIIHRLLASTLATAHGSVPLPATVSDLLVKAISEVDDSIARGITDLFPGGPDAIAKLSDGQIDAIVNDFASGGRNNAKILLGMRGSTALVSLVDPAQENLWVASLGDCQAVLGTKVGPKTWEASLLSSNHNGKNPKEVNRLRSEHPGEDKVIFEERVLGAIAVTKAVGDHEFKLPGIYTSRVLSNAKPGFRLATKVADFITLSLTPPYLSNVADVQHVRLDPWDKDGRFLILCSDGLIDLYADYSDNNEVINFGLEQLMDYIVAVVGNRPDPDTANSNAALFLLRHALGGDNEAQVSQLLTVEMSGKWMDDVTVLVQSL